VKRSSFASALRTEVRRTTLRQLRGALVSVRRLRRQMVDLRLEARTQRRHLERMQRRMLRLRARSGAAGLRVPGRRGRPLTGQSIRTLRDRLRMTREQFAQAMGVSPGSIFGWESGRTRPRAGSLARFQELRKLGVRQARARFQPAKPATRARRGGKAPSRGRSRRRGRRRS
jgi:hypothetical protein